MDRAYQSSKQSKNLCWDIYKKVHYSKFYLLEKPFTTMDGLNMMDNGKEVDGITLENCMTRMVLYCMTDNGRTTGGMDSVPVINKSPYTMQVIFKMINSMEKEVVSVQTALSNLKGFLNRIKNMEKERNLANREVNKPCAMSMACYMDPLFSMREMEKPSR